MAEEKAGKSLVFPIQGHDKCPHCGGEERIGRSKIAELKRDGLLEEHMFPKGPVWAMPLIDQSKPIHISALSISKPKIPILQVYWDICGNPECVGIYVTAVEFIMQEINLPKAPLGGGGMGRNPLGGYPFNKG